MLVDDNSRRSELLGVKVTPKEMLVIESHAILEGLTKSDYIRDVIEQSWGKSSSKKIQPFLAITGQMLIVSHQLDVLRCRKDLRENDQVELSKVMGRLEDVLDKLTDIIARDQEAELNVDNEEEDFE